MSQTMKTVTSLLCACSFFLLAGCSSVYSIKPVGEKPVQLDAQQWDGNWLGADGVITIKVKDGEHGILQVAWIEDLELNEFEVHILKSGDWLFFNIMVEEDDDGYLWGRVEKDPNSIILWDPEISKFRALVTEGALPGEVKKTGEDNEKDSDVILGELTAEHLQFIISGEKGVLFDWDDPLFLIKLSD